MGTAPLGKPWRHEQLWGNHHGQWAELHHGASQGESAGGRSRPGQAQPVRDQVDQRSTRPASRSARTASGHPQRRRGAARPGQGPAGEARRAGRPARRVARRLPAALRRRHDPARPRGLRAPAAVGGHRRRRGARLRGLALPEGVEHPSLRARSTGYTPPTTPRPHRRARRRAAPASAPTTSCPCRRPRPASRRRPAPASRRATA